MTIPFYTGNIPYITTEQMIEVDRAMMEDYTILLIQMMENAGRNLAHLARTRFLRGNPRGAHVMVLAGTGGNGGGAMVCARRLAAWGAHVHVRTTKSSNFTPIPEHQRSILQKMNIDLHPFEEAQPTQTYDLIVDGIIGYSLKGAPRGPAKTMIHWANAQHNTPILSLDAPSGVDTTSGTVFNPTIKATATMTLALPKEGLRAPDVEHVTGELFLADISVPPELYAEPALRLAVEHIFAESDIVRLR